MAITDKAWGNFLSILRIYLLGMLFFSLFRIVLVMNHFSEVQHINEHRWPLVLQSFWMGIRFDNTISCYLLALPILLFCIAFFFKKLTPVTLRIIYILIGVLFTIALLICSIDIPFFNYFFTRLNSSIFNWTNTPEFGFSMILHEPKFLIFLFLFLFITTLYLFFLKKIRKKNLAFISSASDKFTSKNRLPLLLLSLLLVSFTFLGIRGRIEIKSPIKVGMAFFSNNTFINQVGLNPVFTLLRSFLDDVDTENKPLMLIDENIATKTMAGLLHADSSLSNISPIARIQIADSTFASRNVVLVLMEGMTAKNMKRFGNTKNLTPILDSLANIAWTFDNIYSSGLHTYNGIYSTLFSHPAIMHKHSMDDNKVQPVMAGFPNILSKNGYQTIFFTTHDELFDNMSGFLSNNNVQTIIGQKDYPSREIKSALGVPDEYLFRYVTPILTNMSTNEQPFFAAMLTASNHPPLIIPTDNGFKPTQKEEKDQAIEYADWSIGRFLQLAKKEPWYNNTVFVFIADHGTITGYNPYDIQFSFHHIPFIVYAPGKTTPKVINKLGLQTDVFPTITSLLGNDFINNTFGINLLKEEHPYIVFSADTRLACMNDSLLYVYRQNAPTSLYRYKNEDMQDYSKQMPHITDSMQKIAFSWLQTSEWMRLHNKTSIQ